MYKQLVLSFGLYFDTEYIKVNKLGLQEIIYDPENLHVDYTFRNNRCYPYEANVRSNGVWGSKIKNFIKTF